MLCFEEGGFVEIGGGNHMRGSWCAKEEVVGPYKVRV